MKSLLLLALGLARTVVLGARIEAERIVVSVRPYKREQRRCPVCGRACDFYDMANRGAPRLWRAMDLARSACYLEYAPCSVYSQDIIDKFCILISTLSARPAAFRFSAA